MRPGLLQFAVLLMLLIALPAPAEVVFEWATIGDPGNGCDPPVSPFYNCVGSVNETYRISKYEVTNVQYAEFLNAVAASDPNELYSTSMASQALPGGIVRNGSPGSYSYSVIPGRGNKPVNHVQFWDAARFANWPHNGQPTGAQDNSTTEYGAYWLTPTDVANDTVEREADAAFFVPTVHEWYKAAYYDAGAKVYFDYPAGSDAQTACAVAGPAVNTANAMKRSATSRTWEATWALPVRTAPSTRAETSGSGTSRSSSPNSAA